MELAAYGDESDRLLDLPIQALHDHSKNVCVKIVLFDRSIPESIERFRNGFSQPGILPEEHLGSLPAWERDNALDWFPQVWWRAEVGGKKVGIRVVTVRDKDDLSDLSSSSDDQDTILEQIHASVLKKVEANDFSPMEISSLQIVRVSVDLYEIPDCPKTGSYEKAWIDIETWLKDESGHYRSQFHDYHFTSMEKIWYTVTYPLNREFPRVELASGVGFHLSDIASAICWTYHGIYQEEEATMSSEDAVSMRDRSTSGSLNRPATCGRYGIAGHDIEDLVIESLQLNRETGEIILGIGS